MIEIIAVFIILAIVSTVSISYFASVGRKSSEKVIEVTLSEIAKLAVSETRIEGELSIDQIREFSSDFRNAEGTTYSVKQGAVSLKDEISAYIPESKSFVSLAAISESGKCVYVSLPLAGTPATQISEDINCNAETFI